MGGGIRFELPEFTLGWSLPIGGREVVCENMRNQSVLIAAGDAVYFVCHHHFI